MTHGGLLFAPQVAEEGDRTMASINAMINDLGQWDRTARGGRIASYLA